MYIYIYNNIYLIGGQQNSVRLLAADIIACSVFKLFFNRVHTLLQYSTQYKFL